MPISVSLDPTVIPNAIDKTQQEFVVQVILTLTGTYPTNGDTLDLSKLGIPSNSVPNYVEIYETTPAPGPASGYAFTFLPGTNLTNGLMEAFNGTTQFTTQAYGTPPFAITGFQLKAKLWFPVFV